MTIMSASIRISGADFFLSSKALFYFSLFHVGVSPYH